MFKFIAFEIKRNIKRIEVIILIVALLLCEFFVLSNLTNTAKNEDVLFETNSWRKPYFIVQTDDAEIMNEIQSELDYLNRLITQINIDKENKNWNSFELGVMEYMNYEAQLSLKDIVSNEKYNVAVNQDKVNEIVSKYDFISINEHLDLVKPRIVDFSFYPYTQQYIRYMNHLYKNNLMPMTYSHVDSSTLFIQLIRYLLSFLVPILIVLILYNDWNYLETKGILRNLKTIPKMKNNIYKYKLLSNISLVSLIVYVPLLLFSLFLGIKDQFKTIAYPVLSYVPGITKFSFLENNLSEHIEQGIFSNFGLNQLHLYSQVDSGMDFLPMWFVVALTILLFFLLIILLIQITMFLSKQIKNPFVVLIVNIVLIVLLKIITPLGNTSILNIVNPMSYCDPSLNIMGTSYFPWFAGVVVLMIENIIIYFLNNKLFTKK